jgi:predicted nuclease of predicted toxin-antitoxin system
MNFLIDVHLPIRLSKFLNDQPNCSSLHVNQILQKWHTSDANICKYADEQSMVVVTKDTDFRDSHFINKTPQKLIRIVLGNIPNDELIILIAKYLPFILSVKDKNRFYIELSREQITIID